MAVRVPREEPREGEGGQSRSGRRGRRIRGLEAAERRQERRRQLLDAAFELYATRGYANTSIEQLCQRAFVGFKGFYDEFRTKEQLLVEVFDEADERLAATVRAHRRADANDPLRALLAAYVEVFRADPRTGRILLVESAGRSPTVEAHRREARGRHAELIAEAFGSVLGPARPSGSQLRRLGTGTAGALSAIMLDWLMDPAPDPPERVVDDLTAYCYLLVAGLRDETRNSATRL